MIITVDGDATLNGTTDFSDLTVVINNYKGLNKVWQTGDFTKDGTANFSDLTVVLNNYKRTATGFSELAASSNLGVAGVPEPSSLVIFGLGVAGLLTVARRRKLY